MAQDFTFRLNTVTSPGGWTAGTVARAATAPAGQQSVVGPTNAAAQNPVTAAQLRTTPSTLNDPSLGSRQYLNPNTGIRQPVATGSVFSMQQVPPFLAQEVANLNAEQALKRSIQAEWNNRLFEQAMQDDPNSYLWQEALRAASVSPGASVSFGSAVQNPAIGRGYENEARAAAAVNDQRAGAASRIGILQQQLAGLRAQPFSPAASVNDIASRQQKISALQNQIGSLQGVTSMAPAGTLARPVNVIPNSNAISGWTPSTYRQPFIY